MREIENALSDDGAPDDRLIALQLAAATHDVPVALLSVAVEVAEVASRHRVQAVPANAIDALVTQLAEVNVSPQALDVP